MARQTKEQLLSEWLRKDPLIKIIENKYVKASFIIIMGTYVALGVKHATDLGRNLDYKMIASNFITEHTYATIGILTFAFFLFPLFISQVIPELINDWRKK